MKLRLLLPALLGVLALPAVAAAQSTAAGAGAPFDAFAELCVKTQAVSATTLQAADASGWIPLPEEFKKNVRQNEEMDTIDGRVRPLDQGGMFLAVGTTKAFVETVSVPMRACAIGMTPQDPDVAARLRDWAGVPPETLIGGHVKAGYMFTDDGGTHHALTRRQKDSLATYKAGHLVSVTLEEYDDKILVVFLTIPNL